jgi:glycosyltransferase involved in cell wall biosynthesis
MNPQKQKDRRVVFVLPALTAGGAERVLISLMNGLDRDLYTPAIISVSDKGSLGPLIASDIPFHCLHSSFKTCLPLLYKKLKLLKPDIVVSTMAHMNFALLALKPLFPKTKFIVREAITPSYFWMNDKKYRKPIMAFLYRTLYAKADRVLAPANLILQELTLSGVPEKNQMVLPNPVEENYTRAAVKLPPRKNKKTVQFISAGRLHAQKNYEGLIEALAQSSLENWHLTILGEGDQRKKLEDLVALRGLKDNISLPGHYETPWPMIAGCDAFVLPSLYEGLPNVVLESLSCGTPVIAMHSAGGIHEIAAHVPYQSLKIADHLDDFIDHMKDVKPAPTTKLRASLLPERYKKEVIHAQFGKILNQVDFDYTA